MHRHCLFPVALSALLLIGSDAAAQSAAELLERGIYTEETVGDLEAAIQIYDRIVQDAAAGRPHVAQALFRLASCHLKQGQESTALRAFQRLVTEFPDQTELVARARKHLPQDAVPGLPIQPAPWLDGELLRFHVKSTSGHVVGDLTYSAKSAATDGKEIWRVESCARIPSADVIKYARVDAVRDTFRPVNAALIHTQIGRAVAEYTAEQKRMMLSRPGGKPEPLEQALGGVFYDNEQNLYLARRLPLAVGYQTVVPFTGRPGSTYQATIAVVGTESVTVPAGEFECYKVEAGTASRSEQWWISADERKYVVKAVNPEAIIELAEITRLPDRAIVLEHGGVSLRAPRGWDLFESGTVDDSSGGFLVQIFSPGMKVWGELRGTKLATEGEAPQNARDSADRQIAWSRERFKVYELREDSWQELQLAGLPAVSYLADYQNRGYPDCKIVEYGVCLVDGGMSYGFLLAVEKEHFDTVKEHLDSIISSLKLDRH